jgi:exosome complex RNA-binding protein Rrp42 (RNase PH superfamily)
MGMSWMIRLRHILIDPTDEEETFSSTQLSITVDHQGQLCGIKKLGGGGMDKMQLNSCINMAKVRTSKLLELLKG